MPINMKLGLGINSGGKGYTFQTETKTLLAALTGTYSLARKKAIDTMIKSLKTAGVWAKLDVLQIYAAPTAADAVVNWKAPGTFNATLVNSPTLEADRGITGDGLSSYINSGYNPATASINYSLNSAMFGVYSRTNSDSTARNGLAIGGILSNNIIRNSNVFQQTVNGNTASTGVANTNSLGLHISQRNSSTEIEYIKNGASLGTEAQNSVSVPNDSFFICARNVNSSPSNFGTRQFSLFIAGSKLAAGEHSSLFTALEIYLDYIGAGVVS